MEYAEKYLIKRNAWGEPLTLHFVRTVGIHIVVSKLTRISTVAFGNTHDKGSLFFFFYEKDYLVRKLTSLFLLCFSLFVGVTTLSLIQR